MTTIDARGNNHHGAGAPGGGEFAKKANSRPPGGLQAGSHDRRTDRIVITNQQRVAETFAAAARQAHVEANRAAAAAVLREQFPWATTATFTHEWDALEGQYSLRQLRGPDRSIDIEEDESEVAAMSAEQISALNDARRWVGQMGSDAGEQLPSSGEAFDGADSVDLDLTNPPASQNPVARLLDQLGLGDRDGLAELVTDMDGRLGSLVSTSEIEYQLTEGDIAQTDPELAEALAREYGDHSAASVAIAGSGAWSAFRETVNDDLHKSIDGAISDAGWALVNGKD